MTSAYAASNSAIKNDIIPPRTKFLWSSGALGVYFMMNTVAGFVLVYMVTILKIEPALAGFIAFFPKIFDAFTDPLVGGWSDRLKAKGSRRRPFLIFGAILSSLSFMMIFMTPVFGNPNMSALFIFIALMLFSFGYTLFNIPYLAMPAEMTDDYHERTSIHGYRVVSFSIGGLFAGVSVPMLLKIMGADSWQAYAFIGTGGAVLIFTTMFLSWHGTKDAKFSTKPVESPKVFTELGHVFSNKHYIRLLVVKFCQLFGIAATIAALPFFILNVMQRDFGVLAYYFAVSGIVSIMAAPLLLKLSRRIGKSRTYMVSAFCFVFAVSSWSFVQPGEPTWAILIRAFFIGIATTGNVMMAMSMLTDIINYDSRLHDVRREGIFTAFYSFVEKFTFAFGPLIVGVALSIAGFDKTLPADAIQSSQVRQAILLGMAYIPAVMGLLSIWLLSGYKLTEADLTSVEAIT